VLTTLIDVELPSHLRLVVTRLARRLRQESAGGLTPSQTSALATISRHDGVTPSELADLERVRRPTVTRVIDSLEEAGLVTRTADQADRRVCRVAATAAGTALLEELRSRKTAYLARRLATLSPDELQTLARAAVLLERLLEDPQ
jgi:DNA-binding MarR family transcriptional regulator